MSEGKVTYKLFFDEMTSHICIESRGSVAHHAASGARTTPAVGRDNDTEALAPLKDER